MYYKPIHKEPNSNKCLVFLLATFVIIFALLLISASIFRVKTPHIRLKSATLKQLHYSASPPSFFNATLITSLTIRNPNYGSFSFENSKMSVLYAGVKIGNREIGSGRVENRETKEMNVSVNLRSMVSSDINSGMLNLTSYAKFSGSLQMLKIINRRKMIEIACTFNLNFTSHAIQGIQC